MKYSLVTITHTGAYSLVQAARNGGMNVVAPQKVHVYKKVKALSQAQDADLLWCHWSWIGLLPPWVLQDRHVVVVLRDPIECALSAYIRGNASKCPQHARQWLNLFHHREDVDTWVDFRTLGQDPLGWGPVPHLNATSDDHTLKDRYKTHGLRGIRGALEPFIQTLRVVRPEVHAVFHHSGLGGLLRGGLFDPRSTEVPFLDGVV